MLTWQKKRIGFVFGRSKNNTTYWNNNIQSHFFWRGEGIPLHCTQLYFTCENRICYGREKKGNNKQKRFVTFNWNIHTIFHKFCQNILPPFLFAICGMTKQAKILPTTFILCVCIQSTFLNSFLPKNSLHFFLLRCINILRLFCQKQLLVAIQHISVIFAFKRVDFCLMIPHHYQQLGFGCELIVSLSLSSSSYRWLIVGFPKYSSSYRWLKQLLVIVSPSVAFF